MDRLGCGQFVLGVYLSFPDDIAADFNYQNTPSAHQNATIQTARPSVLPLVP
jgi:hypothetical protein